MTDSYTANYNSPLRIGFIEPHLLRFGGIRRMVELANNLIYQGHEVTFFLPADERMSCGWMPSTADVKPLEVGYEQPLDIVLFNEETQWHLPRLFTKARRSVFYALHFGLLYDKPGSWEAIRASVDLVLANSAWTAEMVESQTGQRPEVLLGGINRQHFRPVAVPKRYPIMCVGDERWWKGTDIIERAARMLSLPLETYLNKDLPQERMAQEYCSAQVFVVGSHFEGFGQPGLEALACGVPLVTTDNGGCREYALHEETALVVPPGDPHAMADAIKRILEDPRLAERLARNGLRLVEERFDWRSSAEELALHFSKTLAADAPTLSARSFKSRSPEEKQTPTLSIVTLAWDQLPYTQRCVHSIRTETVLPYELIIVDNGSTPEAAAYAKQAADVAILNEQNLGFAAGMNQGLQAARGRYIAFLNNDTKLPPGWAKPLVSHFEERDRVGIVVPAVTAAGNVRTVRTEPGKDVLLIPPFEAPPSAVLYVMERSTVEELGGWGEEYETASAEDIDLCFKVWVNGRDVIYDQRVLVDHVGKGTSSTKLDNWRDVWEKNRCVLFRKWTAERPNIPRLADCPEELYNRNLLIAGSVAGWMERYFRARTRVPVIGHRFLRLARPVVARVSIMLYRNRQHRWLRAVKRWLRSHPALESMLRRIGDL